MLRRYTLCLSAIGCLATTQSSLGKVFLKYSYKTLEVICPEEQCRWSIPLPGESFAKLAGLPSSYFREKVNNAFKEIVPTTAPVDVWMKVNVTNHIHKEKGMNPPFSLGDKPGSRDPNFGPALIKRFGDYEVITCQGKKGSALRDLVTYAVKKEMGVEKADEDGTSLQHKPGTWGGIRKSDEYKAEICVAKYADLGGTLVERTAQRFCYFLTHTILAIYKEIGFDSLRSGAQEQILTEEGFQALELTSTHDPGVDEGGDEEEEE
jgi:hypothetical protein